MDPKGATNKRNNAYSQQRLHFLEPQKDAEPSGGPYSKGLVQETQVALRGQRP